MFKHFRRHVTVLKVIKTGQVLGCQELSLCLWHQHAIWALVLRLLHSHGKLQKKIQASSFGLAHLWPFWPFGELISGWKISVPPSFSITAFQMKIMKNKPFFLKSQKDKEHTQFISFYLTVSRHFSINLQHVLCFPYWNKASPDRAGESIACNANIPHGCQSKTAASLPI